MTRYLVSWSIDIDDADDPREAAQQAWGQMRRAESAANVFVVRDSVTGKEVTVDLSDPPDQLPDGQRCQVRDGSLVRRRCMQYRGHAGPHTHDGPDAFYVWGAA